VNWVLWETVTKMDGDDFDAFVGYRKRVGDEDDTSCF
jgi:hypothetical protein